jgi:hypothetical protein
MKKSSCGPEMKKPMAKSAKSAPKKKVLAMAKKGPKKMK